MKLRDTLAALAVWLAVAVVLFAWNLAERWRRL